jgi:hypothetical protein
LQSLPTRATSGFSRGIIAAVNFSVPRGHIDKFIVRLIRVLKLSRATIYIGERDPWIASGRGRSA